MHYCVQRGSNIQEMLRTLEEDFYFQGFLYISSSIIYSGCKHLLALIIWNARSSIFKPCSFSTNKQAVPQAIQRQRGIRQFVKVEKVMEASWVCPAAGQMMHAPRLPTGYAKQSVGSDCCVSRPMGWYTFSGCFLMFIFTASSSRFILRYHNVPHQILLASLMTTSKQRTCVLSGGSYFSAKCEVKNESYCTSGRVIKTLSNYSSPFALTYVLLHICEHNWTAEYADITPLGVQIWRQQYHRNMPPQSLCSLAIGAGKYFYVIMCPFSIKKGRKHGIKWNEAIHS